MTDTIDIRPTPEGLARSVAMFEEQIRRSEALIEQAEKALDSEEITHDGPLLDSALEALIAQENDRIKHMREGIEAAHGNRQRTLGALELITEELPEFDRSDPIFCEGCDRDYVAWARVTGWHVLDDAGAELKRTDWDQGSALCTDCYDAQVSGLQLAWNVAAEVWPEATQRDLLAKAPHGCPFCGEREGVTYGTTQGPEGDQVWQRGSCDKCGRSWAEVYRFAEIEETTDA